MHVCVYVCHVMSCHVRVCVMCHVIVIINKMSCIMYSVSHHVCHMSCHVMYSLSSLVTCHCHCHSWNHGLMVAKKYVMYIMEQMHCCDMASMCVCTGISNRDLFISVSMVTIWTLVLVVLVVLPQARSLQVCAPSQRGPGLRSSCSSPCRPPLLPRRTCRRGTS